jgi:sec-independent protein translocase protein TatA
MGMHWYDLLPLALLALLIFGPKRLPEMGASIGKTIREFQKSMREVTSAIDPSSLPASPSEPAASTLPPAQAAQPEQPAEPVSASTGVQPEADS